MGLVGPVGSLWLKCNRDKGDRGVPKVIPEKQEKSGNPRQERRWDR